MKCLPWAGLLMQAALVSVSATDLVPRYITTTRDGVVIRRPYFADGDSKYAIKLDSETKLSEMDGGACFRFDKFPTAVVRLRKSPVRPETILTSDAAKVYEEAARSLLPQGAESITSLEAASDVLPINDWRSFRVILTYRLANESMSQSVTFLNLKPTEQVMLQITSSARDFKQASERAYNIIRRWHKILPQDEAALLN